MDLLVVSVFVLIFFCSFQINKPKQNVENRWSVSALSWSLGRLDDVFRQNHFHDCLKMVS